MDAELKNEDLKNFVIDIWNNHIKKDEKLKQALELKEYLEKELGIEFNVFTWETPTGLSIRLSSSIFRESEIRILNKEPPYKIYVELSILNKDWIEQEFDLKTIKEHRTKRHKEILLINLLKKIGLDGKEITIKELETDGNSDRHKHFFQLKNYDFYIELHQSSDEYD